jgi:Trypsin
MRLTHSLSSLFSLVAPRPALALVLGLATATVACGGTADLGSGEAGKTGQQSSAIQGGKLDTSLGDTFAVGVATRQGGVCSGTLIAPNLVLTARHCVVPPDGTEAVTCADKFSKSIAASSLYVTTDANLFRAKNFYPAAEIITPSNDGFCGNDIALIILEKSIPADQARPVTPAVQFSLSDASIVGDKIAAIGFGVTGPSNSDSGQRRIRENIAVTCVPGDKRYACDDAITIDIDDKAEFVTEGWVCSGDSGSGAFEQKSYTTGETIVLGTLSRGPQSADKCLAAIYTRTDAHAKMIIDAGLKAAEQGAYEAPAWVVPQTDPSAIGQGADCEGETCTDVSETEPASAKPAVTTTTTSSCAASPLRTAAGSGSSSSGAALAALGLALAVLARRKRA